MPGTFSEDQRPTLPGAYTRYIARRPVVTPPAPGVTVALPITHDWGPMDLPTLCGNLQQFEEDFGIDDTPGARAVADAFRGEGLEGLGGAGGVLVVRIGGTSADFAKAALNNPAAAKAFDVKAKYQGTRGNNLKVVVGPIVSGVQEVSVFDGSTTELESYSFTIANAGALAGLAATINASSNYVALTLAAEGTTGLAAGTFSLTGGNDGATLTASDWTDAFGLFANDDFAFFAPMDIPYASGATEPAPTNRALIASLVAWVQAECDRGHRFTAIVGGVLDEPVVDAVARAASINNPNVITVGGPGVNDDTYGPLSTSQLCPRVAGIFAQRGEGQAAHFARLAGTVPRNKAASAGAITLADAETLTNGGVIAIMRDRYTAAPTRLVKAVNTWTSDTPDRPNDVFSNPKFVLSMQQFANECEAEIERELIGKGIVTDSMRNAAAARVLRKARLREGGAFNPGTQVTPMAASSPTDDFIELDVSLVFGRALTQLFINASVQ